MSAEFVAGSVIVCPECWHPVWALERGLGHLDRAGRAASAFRPLTNDDVQGLLTNRPDVPAGWQWWVLKWWRSKHSYATRHAQRPRSGDDTICPHCGGYWVQFDTRDGNASHERGYQLMLLDIPPLPAREGRMNRTRWLRDLDPTAYEITADDVEERPAV